MIERISYDDRFEDSIPSHASHHAAILAKIAAAEKGKMDIRAVYIDHAYNGLVCAPTTDLSACVEGYSRDISRRLPNAIIDIVECTPDTLDTIRLAARRGIDTAMSQVFGQSVPE